MQASHEPGVELNRFCIETRRLDDQPAFSGALKSPGGDPFLRRGPEPPPHWTKVLPASGVNRETQAPKRVNAKPLLLVP